MNQTQRSRLPGIRCGCGPERRVPTKCVGRLPSSLDVDCDGPLILYHGCCDQTSYIRCGSHRLDACVPCSWRYRRLVGRVAGSVPTGGFLYLLTLTAPGTAAHAMPSGDICPCTPQGGVDLPTWNATLGKRWNLLVLQLRRRFSDDIQFFRAVEVQRRGALHLHVIMWSPVPVDFQQVKRLVVPLGFGHSVDLDPLTDAERASRYVSKYVVKAAGERQDVPWHRLIDQVDEDTGEIHEVVSTSATFRTWSCSYGWPVRMCHVRAALRAAAQLSDAPRAPVAGPVLGPERPPVLVPYSGPPG